MVVKYRGFVKKKTLIRQHDLTDKKSIFDFHPPVKIHTALRRQRLVQRINSNPEDKEGCTYIWPISGMPRIGWHPAMPPMEVSRKKEVKVKDILMVPKKKSNKKPNKI